MVMEPFGSSCWKKVLYPLEEGDLKEWEIADGGGQVAKILDL